MKGSQIAQRTWLANRAPHNLLLHEIDEKNIGLVEVVVARRCFGFSAHDAASS
jgi:hypothetical protein